MDNPLAVRFVREVPSAEGLQGEVMFTEPNGDEYLVLCLAREVRTDIGGDDETIRYLSTRYGNKEVFTTARQAVLHHFGG